MIKYRNDIDGLRAYSVIAVIIFHLGFLPNGYLGVDVFFVISGFLITSIIYKDFVNEKFSILKFYERRIRRIIPLLLFITTVAFVIGLFTMLPDDLENLAQSVVASNFSANNILMLITSADYWATKNEYKPLMHTWSLGIEEQYYLVYPFLLLLINKVRQKYIPHFLILISVLSMAFFLFYGKPSHKFYLLQYRFFELSIGGVFAVLFFGKNKSSSITKYSFYISALGLLACFVIPGLSNASLVILTTFFSVVLLTTGGFIYEKDKISRYFFQNKVVTYIGKISFSLYLWHQLIFAFARYTLIEEVDFISSLILVALTFLLSVLTYNYIENIFRNKHVLSTKRVLSILGVVFLLTSSSAMYIYFFGGVYKDFPSLGISKEVVEDRGLNFFSSADNVNIFYNEKVRAFDRDFENNGLKKVLVLGDSYGRDVVNILQEHSKGVEIDLTYFDLVRAKKDSDIVKRWNQADVVICTSKAFFNQKKIEELEVLHNANLDKDKLYVFGTKNFGYSSGIHYNRMSSITEFSEYYANMRKNTLDLEKEYQDEWGDKHISIISSVINEDGKIRIFDDEGKFLSKILCI